MSDEILLRYVGGPEDGKLTSVRKATQEDIDNFFASGGTPTLVGKGYVWRQRNGEDILEWNGD